MKQFLIISAITVCLSMLCGAGATGMDRCTVVLNNATLRAGGWDDIPSDWLLTEEESGYYIVHFSGRITPVAKESLERLGVAIVGYLPHDAYLARLDTMQLNKARSLYGVDMVALYQPYCKIDLELLRMDAAALVPIRVTLFGGESVETARAIIRAAGGTIIDHADNPHRRRISFEIKGLKVAEVSRSLAMLPEVEWVQRRPVYKLCNDYTRYICQSGPYGGGLKPLYDNGVRGEGQLVGVMDTGVDADMCYFYDAGQGLIQVNQPPNYNQRKIVAYVGPSSYANSYDTQGHGTHTAGTIAGNDFATPGGENTGDGIAYMAKLIVQDYGDGWDVYPPDGEYDAHQEVYDIGGRVHSNSWGWPSVHGVYHDDSQEVDQFIWDNPDYSIVYAAGNDGAGSDTIRAPGTAKNVVTVGATESGASQPENNMYFSSHGPTDDGRIKPDITLPGGDIYSASNDSNTGSFNCSTLSGSGTSMATPGVAGSAALVRDYFMQGFYPLGTADPGFAFEPSSALVKAVLVNSGVNMTGTYTADSGAGHADIPSMGQGWGRVTLDTTLFFFNDQRLLFVDDNSDGLSTGQQVQYVVAVNASDEPLEITLVWSDYPSTPAASINLVNDLDLTVSGQQTYLGNHYSGGGSVPGGSADRLNNIECVQLDNPPVGAYTITINAFNIPQGPQPYALVISGPLSFSDGVVSFDSGRYACDGTAAIVVSDADLGGQGMQDVTVVSTTDPTGETVTLTESGPSSGIFEGMVTFTTGIPGAGEIQVVDGDSVTVTYIDADDGHGGVNVPKTDVAEIDCLAPQISGVLVSGVTSSSVTISWTTDEAADSTVTYGDAVPPAHTATDETFTTAHRITLTDLDDCVLYRFSVTSTDAAGNEVTDDNGGVYYGFTTLAVFILFEESMDTNPGWTISGGSWAWGQPIGGGGYYGDPDPTSGYTGTSVYGYNLSGDYSNNMPAYHLTTPSFDCSGATGTTLTYYRWLGVENSSWDHAYLSISTNGSTWTNLFANGTESISDGAWVCQEYDLSTYADGQPAVYLRWTMGTTDSSVIYCGWNIDDVKISYEAPCNTPDLMYESHAVDDSIGDADGDMDAGETVGLQVTLENLGMDATNITGMLSSSSPYITVLDGEAVFQDIPQNQTGNSIAPHFTVAVSTEVPNQSAVDFTLHWQCDQGQGDTGFTDFILAPSIEYVSHQLMDNGDMDGNFDPGETVIIPVTIGNTGSDAADGITAVLSSDHSAYISISDNSADFGSIGPGEQGFSQAPHFTVNASPFTPNGTVVNFLLAVSETGGYATAVPFQVEVTTSSFSRRYFWNMDSDPGWTGTGEWEWGVPAGQGGDPSAGYNGPAVYGYNLNGEYANGMSEEQLTTTVLDCSSFIDTELRFMRWLGVESAQYDHAAVRISTNGTTWTDLWTHTGATIDDQSWTSRVYDISAVADGQPTVYLRWVMGSANGNDAYCGWNLDDIEVWADSSAPATVTPTPIIPPTFTSVPCTRTPIVTATPSCPTTGAFCEISQSVFVPGDQFTMTVSMCNGGNNSFTAEVYVILDVFGSYWFWPSWSIDMDFAVWSIPACDCLTATILDFIWPPGGGAADDIAIWVAMLEPGTYHLIGEYGYCPFDYHD
ncbi:S8 family serine peptidase [bacterium]|nr:S8 family serine peptidase [candidate division CSSED10-310 bacterium]